MGNHWDVSCGRISSYKDGQLMVDKPWEEGAIKSLEKHRFLLCPFIFMLKQSFILLYLKLVALSTANSLQRF
jgi:hypothetical protein